MERFVQSGIRNLGAEESCWHGIVADAVQWHIDRDFAVVDVDPCMRSSRLAEAEDPAAHDNGDEEEEYDEGP